MTDTDNTIAAIGRHLILAVKPLQDAFKDLDSFRGFMYRLGWNVSSLPPAYANVITKVDGAVVALEALVDEPTISEALELLLRAKEVYDAIDGLSSAPAPTGVNAGEFLAEIGERLFEILLTEYLNNALPEFYNIFCMTGIIEREYAASSGTRPSYVRIKFKWDEIPKLFTEPDKLPEKVFGWGSNDLKFDLIARYLMEFFFALKFPASIVRVDKELREAYQGSSNTADKPMEMMLKFPFFYGQCT